MKTLLSFFFWSSVALADTPFPGPSELAMEVNKVRAAHGLYQLTQVEPLICAANRHAKDLAQTLDCSHEGSDGSTWQSRAKDCGTRVKAEILACGYGQAVNVIKRWMNDKMSKAILLDDDAQAMGTAKVDDVWILLIK